MTKHNTSTNRADADDRLVRNSSTDIRGDRGTAEDAAREADTGLLSSSDMERLIEDEFEQTALPTAPRLKGYHVVWLTTTSQYDPVQKRERLGYTPVRRDEMPGFDPSNGKSLSSFEGNITCNEMVLFKIPDDRYQVLMRYFHHKKPMQEETGIVDSIRNAAGQRDSNGKTLGQTEGDGINDMETGIEYAQRQVPIFA